MAKKPAISIAGSDRARVPFGIIAVLLLVMSLVSIVAIQSRGEPQVDRSSQLTDEQIDRMINETVNVAVEQALHEAGQNPVTEPADNEFGDALQASGDGGEFQNSKDHIWHQYIRLLIYFNLQQAFEQGGFGIDGIDINIDLPSVGTSQSEIEAAIDRVDLEVTEADPDDADLDAGEAQLDVASVSVSDIEVEADSRFGVLRQTRTTTGEAEVVSDVTVMHRQVLEYEDRIESAHSREVSLRMLGFGMLKAQVEWFVGGGIDPGVYPYIIDSRELEWWTNQVLYDVQEDVFGSPEPRAARVNHEIESCMMHEYLGNIFGQGLGTGTGAGAGSSFAPTPQVSQNQLAQGIIGGLLTFILDHLMMFYPSGFACDMHMQSIPDGTSETTAELADTADLDGADSSEPMRDWENWHLPAYPDDFNEDGEPLTDNIEDQVEEAEDAGEFGGSDEADDFLDNVDSSGPSEMEETEISAAEVAETVFEDITGQNDEDTTADVSERAADNAQDVYDDEATDRDEIEGLTATEIDALEDLIETIDETIEAEERDFLAGTADPSAYQTQLDQIAENRHQYYETPNSTLSWTPGTAWGEQYDINYLKVYLIDEVESDLEQQIEMHEQADTWMQEESADANGWGLAETVAIHEEIQESGLDGFDWDNASTGASDYQRYLENRSKHAYTYDHGSAAAVLLGEKEEYLDSDPTDVANRHLGEEHLFEIVPVHPDSVDEPLPEQMGEEQTVMIRYVEGNEPEYLLPEELEDEPDAPYWNLRALNPDEDEYEMVNKAGQRTVGSSANVSSRVVKITEAAEWDIGTPSRWDIIGGADTDGKHVLLVDGERPRPDASDVFPDGGTYERSAEFDVRTAPVYMGQDTMTRAQEQAIRPSDMGPEHNYNAFHVPMSSQTFSIMPAPGVPIIPFPTKFWFASINVLLAEVKAEYVRFELRSSYNTDSETMEVTEDSVAIGDDDMSAVSNAYVRESRPVDITTDDRHRVGRVEPVGLDSTAGTGVVAPGLMPSIPFRFIHGGNYGVGNRIDGVHTLQDCSPHWPAVGPDVDPGVTGVGAYNADCFQMPQIGQILMHGIRAAVSASHYKQAQRTKPQKRHVYEDGLDDNVNELQNRLAPSRGELAERASPEERAPLITGESSAPAPEPPSAGRVAGEYLYGEAFKYGGSTVSLMAAAFKSYALSEAAQEDEFEDIAYLSPETGNGPVCRGSGDDLVCYDENGEMNEDELPEIVNTE